MGVYLNPVGESKLSWLQANGIEMPGPPSSLSVAGPEIAIVCLVKNPAFDAAAVCYSDNELAAFSAREQTVEEKRAEDLSGALDALSESFLPGAKVFRLDADVPPRPKRWFAVPKAKASLLLDSSDLKFMGW